MNNTQEKKLFESVNYGDYFSLGQHVLCCGDARDKEIVKKAVGKSRIDLIVCDPPYAASFVENKKDFAQLSNQKEIINDNIKSEEEYAKFIKEWLEKVKPYLNNKNSAYIFNSDIMILALREGMKQAGFHFSQLLIWIKNHSVIGRKDYLLQHELIAFGWFGTHKFYKAKDKSLIFYPKPNKSKLHPTMKPVGLIRRLILNSSKIGDVVYDPFLGSGTAILACEQTKRCCIGIELDPEYCKVVMDRYKKLTNIEPIKIHG